MGEPRSDRDIGGSASRGVKFTAYGQMVAMVTQLLGVLILARLIAPSDYGLLAMVMAIVVVGDLIRDFGLANAAIQAHTLSAQQRTNLFWINTALGVVCAAILLLASPYLAAFYDEPRIEPLAQALSITFVLGGIASQPKAHLARDMRFGALNVTDVLPGVVGLIAAIATATLGWGLWALVTQRIVISVAMLTLAVSLDRWRPGLPRRVADMAPLIRYGLNLVGTQLISSMSRNADYVVMGYRFGPSATGLYSRAFELVVNTINQLNAPTTKVAVPVLSRLQDDPARHEKFLLTGQRAVLFAIIPLLGLGGALAAPLVHVALGPQWTGVVPFLQALIVVSAADRILGYATWWFALSRGRTDVTLKVTIAKALILFSGILIGSAFGPVGIAWGYAIAALIGWLVDLAMYRWLANAPSWKLLINALVVLLMNAPAVAVTHILITSSTGIDAIPQLAAGVGCYALTWAASVALVPVFRRELRNFVRLLRAVLRR